MDMHLWETDPHPFFTVQKRVINTASLRAKMVKNQRRSSFKAAAVSLRGECYSCDHQRSVSPQAAAQRGGGRDGESRMLSVKDENKLASLPQSLPLLQHQVQAIRYPPCSLWSGEGGRELGEEKGKGKKGAESWEVVGVGMKAQLGWVLCNHKRYWLQILKQTGPTCVKARS